ncbi:hypothetical protein HUJ04_005697 [Dendroctonus ponderosae]
MVPNQLIPALLVLVLVLASAAEAQLRCYQCNSYRDGARGSLCHNPMAPNVSTVVCSSDEVCSTVSYITGQILVTSRACDPRSNSCRNIESGLRALYPDLSRFYCSTCSSNFCNSAGKVGISMVLAIGCLLMSRVI